MAARSRLELGAERSRRLPASVAPLAAGAVGLAGAAYVRAVDPSRGGLFPPCPFHRLTGLWCPGCGMTRALHDLLHGHLVQALGANLFVLPTLALGACLWLSWLWPALGRPRWRGLNRVPAAAWSALVGLALVYGVLRNLTPFAALAP